MKKLLLKNGNITDAKNNVEGKFDILIENGLISDVSEEIDCAGAEILDCTGLEIIPGICDMHVHFREPGQTQKEDIISGSEAAAAGGVTAVLCMPNTEPVLDTPEQIRYVRKKAKDAKIKVYPACSLTKGLLGNELCDYKALHEAGAIAATDDGRPVENAFMMYKAMELAHYAGLRVISHCEDLSLTNGGLINEGRVSRELGIKGVCKSSENAVAAREISIAMAKQLPIHIAHVSTQEVVKMLRDNTGFGVMVTAETAPHYFTLTEDKLYNRDADYRMAPPLRLQRDVNSIISAICDGTIDCIVTDHAPHTPEEKARFETAPNGVIGLETSLAVTLTALYHRGLVSLERIVRLMCVNPRRLLGLHGGGLSEGEAADIAIFDPMEEWVVNPERFRSKARNSCFKGMTLKGRVKYTLVDGNIVYKDN